MKFLNRTNKTIRGVKAKTFCQHSFRVKVELMASIPRVLISRLAYNKMWHYVDIADKEISWLGTVVEDENDFLIEDVFLLKQEVDHTATEITLDGLAEFGQEILSKPNGIEIYENIRFWGHSHVNMGTSPSPQDEEQMEVLRESEHPFFIRGILNKSGRMEFSIFLYSAGIKIVDAEWAISEPIDELIRAEIETEFKDKVVEAVHFYSPQFGAQDYGHNPLHNASAGVPRENSGKTKRKKGGIR